MDKEKNTCRTWY